MTNKLLNHSNNKLTSKIKYTDLAIAVALSSASLFLVPAVSKAATTTDTTTSPTSSTEVSTTDSSTTSGSTTTAPTSSTTTTATTPTSTTTTTTAPTTSATGTVAPTTTTTTTATSTTAPATSTDSSASPTTSTSSTGTTAPTTSTSTASTTGTSATSGSSSSITLSSFKVPASGYEVTSVPTTSTTTPATYTVSVQAYGTDGNALGSAIPVTTTQAGDSTYDLTFSPDLLTQLSSSIPNSANYTAWAPDSLTSPLSIPITNSNVCVKVYYALKTVTATYTYVDETTGKPIYTQTDTYDFDSPTYNTTFKTDGIKPADATLSSTTHLLTADDTSTAAQTDPTQLPYFGPTGQIFNNSSYVLDATKSGGVTPLTYTYWPTGNISDTFYYTEGTKPSITISAVDSLGNTIKTFDSGLSPTATLPSQTVTGTTYLPTSAAATIPGYTLTGFKAIASDSLSGAAPTEIDNTFTPEQYEAFLASPANTLPYDTRALGDYQDLAIDYTYQGDPVTLTIQPVDAAGDPIGSPISAGSGFVGESLTLTNPAVAGFLPESDTSAITVQPGQTAIPVTYEAVSATPSTDTNTSKSLDSGSTDETETGTSTSPTESGSTETAAPSTTSGAATTPTSTSASSTATAALASATTSSSPALKSSAPTSAASQPVALSATSTAKPTALSYAPTTATAPVKTSTASPAADQLAPSSTTGSKLPQTGNKTVSLLSAIGIILLGLVGLSVDKLKKVF